MTLAWLLQEEEVKVAQEEEEVQDLVQEVQSLPPPDPRWAQLRTLGEEQACAACAACVCVCVCVSTEEEWLDTESV